MSTAGVLLTTLFTGLFILGISDNSPLGLEMSLVTSLLLAATMSSTDSASIFNVLRTQKIGLKYNLRSLLKLESGSNDPMAYMLTVTLIQLLTVGSTGITGTLTLFVLQFVIGGLGGFLLGKLSVWILGRIKLETPSLYPILLLSIVSSYIQSPMSVREMVIWPYISQVFWLETPLFPTRKKRGLLWMALLGSSK